MNTMMPFTNRRGFLKSLAVSAGGCAFCSYFVLPESALAKMSENYLDKIPVETRWAITSGGFVYLAISEDKALFDKVGKEKYNEIKFKKGLASGARNKKQADNFGFTGNDAQSTFGGKDAGT